MLIATEEIHTVRKYAKIKKDLIEAEWSFIPGSSANVTALSKAVDWLIS